MKILNLAIVRLDRSGLISPSPNDKIITHTNPACMQLNPPSPKLLICRREAVARALYYTAATAINNTQNQRFFPNLTISCVIDTNHARHGDG